MPVFRLLSSAEQLAAHLRGELAAGVWRGEMPGAAAELAMNHKTVEVALALLEDESLLAGQGPRLKSRPAATPPEKWVSRLQGFMLVEEMAVPRRRLETACAEPGRPEAAAPAQCRDPPTRPCCCGRA